MQTVVLQPNQLIVTVEDAALIPNIKNAIKMLRGVINVKTARKSSVCGELTQAAIDELDNGGGRTFESLDDLKNYINGI